MKSSRAKVTVAMSGGVDSSVAAAVLLKNGYEVKGAFIKAWHPDFVECSWREDRMDAMRVCAELGIPFETVDLESEYKKSVVDYMVDEYSKGRTPNPDVMCNKHVKFGAFLKHALKSGADYIATGHYAKVEKLGKKYALQAGSDKNKDQTYFLWTLKQSILQHTLFPIGSMKKIDVRRVACERGLHIASKKDSQGICFLGKVDLREFLKRFIDVENGDVLDTKGKVIGRHEGSILYTNGQRHGFTISKKTPNDAPRYVVGRDLSRNTITVSTQIASSDEFDRDEIEILNTNWISGEVPLTDDYSARIRYRQPLEKCSVLDLGENASVIKFAKPQKSVSSGQSVVIYKDDNCLGGGIIK